MADPATSVLSLWSSDSVLCIGSRGSVLSIGSVGSVLSIGSVGSCGSLFSVCSGFSAGCAASWLSRWSLLSHRSSGAAMGDGEHSGQGRIGPPAVVAAAGSLGWAGYLLERRFTRRAPG